MSQISVYLGWLSVATIANIALFGVSQNWSDLLGIAAPIWAAIINKQAGTQIVTTTALICVVVLLVALAAGLFLRRRAQDPAPARA